MSSPGACKSGERGHRVVRAILGFAGLALASISAWAQVAPNLGTAAPFTVLGRNAIPTSGTVTCTDTGPGIGIFGQVGTTFNAITTLFGLVALRNA